MIVNKEVRKTILEIVEKIKREYQPDKIILFGSYAYGSPDRDSDIDLLIIKKTHDRPIDRRVSIARIVSDPQRLIPVEPIQAVREYRHSSSTQFNARGIIWLKLSSAII